MRLCQDVGGPINVEENIGKTVGRGCALNPARYGAALQRSGNQIMRSQRRTICPKGVFRFATHEEADRWLLKMMVRNRAQGS